MLTFALVVVSVATVVAVFASVRRDLRRLAVLSLLGIPAQALLGGVTVLTGLNPWTVAAHFLLSMVLVAIATVLWLRSREPGVGQLLVRRPFWLLTVGIAATVAAVQVIGTVVTGSGPHSGDPGAGRTGFDPELVSQLHADVVFLLSGSPSRCWWRWPPPTPPAGSAAPPATCWSSSWRRASIGYVQYFTHVPALLVLLHMTGAVLITVYTARLLWSVRGPASELPPADRRPSAAARWAAHGPPRGPPGRSGTRPRGAPRSCAAAALVRERPTPWRCRRRRVHRRGLRGPPVPCDRGRCGDAARPSPSSDRGRRRPGRSRAASCR